LPLNWRQQWTPWPPRVTLDFNNLTPEVKRQLDREMNYIRSIHPIPPYQTDVETAEAVIASSDDYDRSPERHD
jgi:hypothetical protein